MTAQVTKQALNLECPMCGGIWTPRVDNPRACPICKRYFKPDMPPIPTSKPISHKRIKKPKQATRLSTAAAGSVLCSKCSETDPMTSTYAVAELDGKPLCTEHLVKELSR